MMLLAGSAARAELLPGVEILVRDDFIEEDLPRHVREGWWALCPTEPGAAKLMKSSVKVRAVQTEMGASLRVSAAPCREALALVRARDGLAERDLPTARAEISGERLQKVARFDFGGARFTLRFLDERDHDQFFELQSGAKKQRIRVARAGGDWSAEDWHLVWAGDLDGDGALDLILRSDGDGDQIELFLSSRAKKDQLLGRAALITTPGC